MAFTSRCVALSSGWFCHRRADRASDGDRAARSGCELDDFNHRAGRAPVDDIDPRLTKTKVRRFLRLVFAFTFRMIPRIETLPDIYSPALLGYGPLRKFYEHIGGKTS